MRILWASNAPHVCTGYGMQTAAAAAYLSEMGHEIGIHCFYGLEGSRVEWGNTILYPNNTRTWEKEIPQNFNDFKADVLITLVDIWALENLDARIPWVPWMPIDHDPVPPRVLRTAKDHLGVINPIAMTRFGQKQLQDNGIPDTYYIPHSVNTVLFQPNHEIYETQRKHVHWEDKFVIGTVGTNHNERKNWTASMQAVAKFAERHPGEVKYYAHTEAMQARGINLGSLADALKLQGSDIDDPVIGWPNQSALALGMSRDYLMGAYNAMDVFLLPSKGEGFGIPIVEAQACGVPVIITKCTGHEELMGGGWFIENLWGTWESKQDSWQFNCSVDEIVDKLELAYQAKKDGSIQEQKDKARAKALEYEDGVVYSKYWPPVLADIEQRVKAPKNMEGVQIWRKNLIPKTCMPRKVLDIGCGITKPYRNLLRPLGEYIGVDIKEGNDIVVADAHHLPFGDKEFGFVWCSEMLEHCDEPEQVVAEAKRVGVHGVITFSTPANPNFRMDPEHREVPQDKVAYTVLGGGDGMISW